MIRAGCVSAATQLGGLASDHAGQLSSFHGNVATALAGWKGPLAVHYAVAAGQCSARFTAVAAQLKAAQIALSNGPWEAEGPLSLRPAGATELQERLARLIVPANPS